MEPILLAALLYLAFASGLRHAGSTDFFIFLIFGLIPLKWTQSCISSSAKALVSSKGIIGQVYMPKWIFPLGQNVSQFIRFIFVIPILIGISLVAKDINLTSYWIIVVVIIIQFTLNAGVSLLFSSITPLIPDLTHIIPLVSMGLMFTSGVFFDISDKPESIKSILELNPMVNILACYRDVLLYGKPIEIEIFFYPLLFGIFSLLLALLVLKIFDRIYPKII